mgnify:CR=1 FL=1
MINLLALIVCFFASVIGAICGIGGGVIIKPVLDSVGILVFYPAAQYFL